MAALVRGEVGEPSLVADEQRERLVGLADDGVVVDDVHARHDDREQRQQRAGEQEREFQTQPPDHGASSSEYPAFRWALI